MTALRPYLTFAGNCKEAMEFYAAALGGQVTSITPFKTAPMPVPPGSEGMVLHCELKLPMGWIFASDAMPGKPPSAGNNMSISLSFDDVELARSSFEQLSQGGTIKMPMEETFWGEEFGMLTDRYGVQWMFSAKTTAS